VIAKAQPRFMRGFSRTKTDILDDLLHHIESGEPASVDVLEEAHAAIVLLRLQKNRLLIHDAPDVALTGVDDVVCDLESIAARLPAADAATVRDGIAEILRHRSVL
jgi:hypothetical protein